ncbi:GrxA family glutaredoxin [Pseudoalteromonas ruthenica]|uniref:Glutaredoxin n=1 Tax=Pseudoalteromonas ruthenica TaxID=151081 RepID=A0A0F4PLL1_9GAMM|nr:GrxA family glutaredoxin [Pseudoalteromonas ruthenica]KJY96039.1 glutaredoxin [Pseudoalteromonas ruthenica]KJY96810.1 glutaredoxin [Pseudoalteromonas ruthenica]TMO88832.1 GrxA family glutaredoxin [Pseudoalteromonas ruthenica]TMO91447.1 GrxA family glutaredoxin [Pseudoalteromonas ruthenica]TMP01547.1 GrxA family glutaredoxin [Pseudoalteromonas ruthenica]
MLTVIFGREGCPFCVRAKDVAEQLMQSRDDFKYRYIDIVKEGISKADLEKSAGKPCETVPQIFIDQAHIGGFTEFEAYAKENLGLYQD